MTTDLSWLIGVLSGPVLAALTEFLKKYFKIDGNRAMLIIIILCGCAAVVYHYALPQETQSQILGMLGLGAYSAHIVYKVYQEFTNGGTK